MILNSTPQLGEPSQSRVWSSRTFLKRGLRLTVTCSQPCVLGCRAETRGVVLQSLSSLWVSESHRSSSSPSNGTTLPPYQEWRKILGWCSFVILLNSNRLTRVFSWRNVRSELPFWWLFLKSVSCGDHSPSALNLEYTVFREVSEVLSEPLSRIWICRLEIIKGTLPAGQLCANWHADHREGVLGKTATSS